MTDDKMQERQLAVCLASHFISPIFSQVVQLVRAAIPGSSSGAGGNGADGSVSRGKAVGPEHFFDFVMDLLLCRFSDSSAFFPGVGISFVRRAGGADSKFVVKRLVQGSDTAMQGDVEVNDVVVRVSARALRFIDFDGGCGRSMATQSKVGTKRRCLLT